MAFLHFSPSQHPTHTWHEPIRLRLMADPNYLEITMKVTIETPEGVIWMRDAGAGEGMASRGYMKDGTQQKIITALEEALSQAKGEALCWDDAD